MVNNSSENSLNISWKDLLGGLCDPAMVLDLNDRIVEMNPAAAQAVCQSPQPSRDSRITDFFPEWGELHGRISPDEVYRAEIYLESVPMPGDYELVVSPLKENGVQFVGRLLIFRMISEPGHSSKDLARIAENYRRFEDHSADLFAISDAEVNFIYISPSYETTLGVDRAELIGRSVFELVHPDDLGIVLDKVLGGFTTPSAEPVTVRYRMVHRDGRAFWFETLGSILLEDDGRIKGAVFSTRNITDSIIIEKALRESEKKYRELIENIDQGIFRVDTEGLMVYVSSAVTRILGYSEEQLIGKHFSELVHPEDLEVLVGAFKNALKGQGARTEYRVKHRSGEYRWINSSSSVLISDEGIIGIQGIFGDITDRRDSQRILRESEEKFVSIFKYMPGAISLARASDGRYLDVNHGFTTVYGWERDEAIGKTGLELGIWSNPKEFYRRERILADKKVVRDFEFEYQTKSGECGTVINQSGFVEINGVPHLLSISVDITDRKKNEENAAKLTAAVEYSAEKISIFDANELYVYVNRTFEKMTGYKKEEIIGRHPGLLKGDRHDPAIAAEMMETVRSGRIWFGTIYNRTKDDRDIELDSTISPIFDREGNISGYVAVEKDVTEQKKLENQLRQSQKMEAIGTMAGGIAHDFNNLLTVILGNAQMAIKQAPEGSRIKAQLESLFKAGERATDLVRQILTFSRLSDRNKIQIDFYQVMEETLKLVRSLVPSSIEIQNELRDESVHVLADPTELHQIVMNLSINACHAIGDLPGIITIGSETVDISGSDTFHKGQLKPGRYVLLKVDDTGKGIEPSVIEKIFDPYFTTKAASEGTGLGLSVVHGIVTGYGGTIQVYSESGTGTSFNVYLPIVQPGEEDLEVVEDLPRGGSEQLLVVDDEDVILEMLTEMLEHLGYEVETYSTSHDALEAFLRQPGYYDLVITDQTMPQMTGLILAEKILAERPDIPVILSTGFSAAITPEKMEQVGIKGCLMKPILMEKLSQSVRKALEEKS